MSKQEVTTKNRKDALLGELIEQAGGERWINEKVRLIDDITPGERYRLKLQLIEVLKAYKPEPEKPEETQEPEKKEAPAVLTFEDYFNKEIKKGYINPPAIETALEAYKAEAKTRLSMLFKSIVTGYKDYLFKLKLNGKIKPEEEKALYNEVIDKYNI